MIGEKDEEEGGEEGEEAGDGAQGGRVAWIEVYVCDA